MSKYFAFIKKADGLGTVRAYRIKGANGCVIDHRAVDHWVVTDINSGLAVCYGPSQKRTIEIYHTIFEMKLLDARTKPWYKEWCMSFSNVVKNIPLDEDKSYILPEEIKK